MGALRVGETVAGSLVVQAVLSDHAAADVYAVVDRESDAQCVLEVPWQPLTDDAIGRAGALVGSEHPAVGRVLDVVEVGEHAGVLTERLEGPPLSRLVAGGRLPLPVAISIARGLVGAVATLQQAGVPRVGPTPTSLHIALSGAQYLPRLRPSFADADPEAMPAAACRYLAPEEVEWAEDIDGRADVFTLGVMLYELFVGKSPFDGETSEQVRDQVRKGMFTPPHQLAPELPSALERLLVGCLVPVREERIPSVRHITRGWEQIELGLADPPAPTRAPRKAEAPAASALAPELDLLAEPDTDEIESSHDELRPDDPTEAGPPIHQSAPIAPPMLAESEDITLELALSSGSIDDEAALEVMRDILGQLAELHRAGKAHGVVCPAAVELHIAPSGRVRAELTSTVLKSPVQMLAPERLAAPAAATPAGDVFAAGALLYEMLQGEALFPASRSAAAREPSYAVLDQMIRRTPALGELIAQCVDEDPLARPKDAARVASLLLGETPAPAPSAAGTPVAAPPPSNQSNVFSVVAGIVALVVGAVVTPVVFTVFMLMSFSSSEAAQLETTTEALAADLVASTRDKQRELVASLVASGGDYEALSARQASFEAAPDARKKLVAAVALYETGRKEFASLGRMSWSERQEVEEVLDALRHDKEAWQESNDVWRAAWGPRADMMAWLGFANEPYPEETAGL